MSNGEAKSHDHVSSINWTKRFVNTYITIHGEDLIL